MSTLSDLLTIRKQRLALNREADLLEQQEKKLQNDLIEAMRASGDDTFTDGDDEAYLTISQEPVVTSWPKLLDYIRENDALDILQKRVTASSVKARWADNVSLPGVDAVEKASLKFNI